MSFPRFTVRGFKPPREAMLSSLGTLERKTLEEVWRLSEVTVTDIVNSFGGTVAYTTLMTTLDRLYKKGYLERRKSGRAFVYTAKHTSDELQRGIAGDVITGLIDSATRNVEPVLACIVDAVSEKDRELLDDLERLIRQKKEQLASGR